MTKIIAVDEHASKLDCVLRTLNFDGSYDDWDHICSWLQMAAAVDEIRLVTEKFDSSLAFCSSARSFENERSLMLSEIAQQLTVFNFIWGAFESLIETVEPFFKGCNSKKHGKISAARYIIRKNYTQSLSGYTFVLEKLLKLFDQLIVSHEEINHQNLLLNEKGIFLVYKIRNKLAHGSFSFPYDPYDHPNPQMNHSTLISISSRIVLFTIQMLLLAYFKKRNHSLYHLFLFEELEDLESIKIHTLLEFIHIENYENLID